MEREGVTEKKGHRVRKGEKGERGRVNLFGIYPFHDIDRHLIGKMQYEIFFSTFMEGISRDTGSW